MLVIMNMCALTLPRLLGGAGVSLHQRPMAVSSTASIGACRVHGRHIWHVHISALLILTLLLQVMLRLQLHVVPCLPFC